MASDQSPFGTFANVSFGAPGGSVAWANPGNAISSNDSRSSAQGGGGAVGSNVTNYLHCTAPSALAIPSGATIDGIVIRIERQYNSGEGENGRDLEVKLIKGGVKVGDNKATAANWPAVDGSATYGGAADLWGITWADTDFAAGFGVSIQAQATALAAEMAQTWQIGFVDCDVYYTEVVAGVPIGGLATMRCGR